MPTIKKAFSPLSFLARILKIKKNKKLAKTGKIREVVNILTYKYNSAFISRAQNCGFIQILFYYSCSKQWV
jgi:hypothetical protein